MGVFQALNLLGVASLRPLPLRVGVLASLIKLLAHGVELVAVILTMLICGGL